MVAATGVLAGVGGRGPRCCAVVGGSGLHLLKNPTQRRSQTPDPTLKAVQAS